MALVHILPSSTRTSDWGIQLMAGSKIDIFVDVSGSMAGYKIEAVNRHLKLLLSELGADADMVHLYSFAETTQRQRFSRNPNFIVRKESTSYAALADYISTLVDEKKNSSIMFVYSDGVEVEDSAEVDFVEKIKQKLDVAYSTRVGILVSPKMKQDNLVCSISNVAVFGIGEDISTISAVLRPALQGGGTHLNEKPKTKKKGTKK